MAIPSVSAPPLWSRASSSFFTTDLFTGNSDVGANSGTVALIFQSDPTNGSFVDRVIWQPRGGNEATVGRIFLNNGGGQTTLGNNAFIGDVQLPKTIQTVTASLSATMWTPVGGSVAIPPNFRLYCTLSSSVVQGFDVTAFGGPY
jgi:hypothetical protein